MTSLYWDNFKLRENETIECIKNRIDPPIRRVSVFITNTCNFRCAYCNMKFGKQEMYKDIFDDIVKQYRDSIIHITGGEPSVVGWLYNYIDSNKGTFHLNTNAYIVPPTNIKRLKVSLDSCDEEYFNKLVCKSGAFEKICQNIKDFSPKAITSITSVLNRENYKDSPKFMAFCRKEFPNLYAVFFSIYKGKNPRFIMNDIDTSTFFDYISHDLEKEMDKESLSLFRETIDEKRRIVNGERFPENKVGSICYLSLSERAYDWNGKLYRCSHLLRDGVYNNDSKICNECRYGCNRRLVKFNQDVQMALT